jgi:aromatic-L-amino-acid/L-tryptophan decarboxylase
VRASWCVQSAGDEVGGPEPDLLRLDVPREEALDRAAQLIGQAWRSFDADRPDLPAADQQDPTLCPAGLPERPSAVLPLLEEIGRIFEQSMAPPRPGHFAFVGSSGLEVGVIADALAAAHDLNLALDVGVATQIERQAVRWVGEFIGFPAAGGAFTSGGTVSNLTALAAAREHALPGIRSRGLSGHRATLYGSAEVHHSIVRAAELLGIGSAQVRALPIDGRRALKAEAVARAIDRDRRQGLTPVAVVATAGTTLTGAVDPIGALADVCQARDVWLHVDGAYGLPAAAVPSCSHLFEGLERADSCAVDAHKWLYLPKACGIVLVRHEQQLAAAFRHDAAYLPHERPEPRPVDTTLEYSRPFRALKLWLAFRAHGAAAFRAAIERNLGQARLLYRELQRHPDLQPLGPPVLSILPFRHLPPDTRDLDQHNWALGERLMRDPRVQVAPALIDGRVYLRPCFVNFRTTDEDIHTLVQIVLEVGADLATERRHPA